MNRAALKRDGAIGRRRTQNQVDGEISVNRLNRKPFIGFAQNANISVYVGIHEKLLEIGGPSPNSRGLYENRTLDRCGPTEGENVRVVGVSDAGGAVQPLVTVRSLVDISVMSICSLPIIMVCPIAN